MALVGEAEIVIRAITTDFKKEVEKALRDLDPMLQRAGQQMGQGFSNSFRRGSKGMFSDFLRESKLAKEAFNALVRKSFALGPTISGAVSAISDLVSGIFALGSAVGAATPALAAFPGIIASIGQAALTAKLAFGGVGKAIQAIQKQKNAGPAQKATNQRAIEEARRRLALIYQNTADQMAAADDRLRRAQVALNMAYIEGQNSLRDLGFSAEEAAISQDKAALQLARARETLQRSMDLPTTDRARIEAELAFKEADLNYRQSVAHSNDIRRQEEYAAKTGIEGTSQVIAAKRELQQAEVEVAKTQRNSNQQIIQGQLAIQKAMAAAKKSSAEVTQAMKELSPEAQKFAKYIAGLHPVLLELRAAAGKELFGPLTSAIENLRTRLLPVMLPILQKTGKVVGTVVENFSKMLTSSKNLGIIDRVFGESNLKVFANIGKAFANIADAALTLLDAARPLTVIFSNWIVRLSETIRISTLVKGATGQLGDSFSRAGDIVKHLAAMFKSTGSAIKEFGGAAVPAGIKIVDAFKGAMDKFKEFSQAGKRSGDLQAYFNRVADNVIAIGTVLSKVAAAFFALAGNSGVGAFSKALEPVAGIMAQIAYQLTSNGDLLGKFVAQFVLLLQKFTESGSLQNFFNVLIKALEVVNAIFSNTVIQKVFLFMAAIHGLALGLGVVGRAGETALKILTGKLMILPGMFSTVNKSAGATKGVIGALDAGILNFGERIATGVDKLKLFNAGQIDFGAKLSSMKTSLALTGSYLKDMGKELFISGKNALVAGVKWIFGGGALKFLGAALKAPIKAMATFTAEVWANTVALMANPITGIFTIAVVALTAALAAMAAVFVFAYKASKPLQDAVAGLGKALTDTLNNGIKMISERLSAFMPKMKNVGDLFKWIGDNIAKYVMPVVKFLLVGALQTLIEIVVTLIDYLKYAFDVFAFPFKVIYNLISMIWRGTDGLKAIWNDFVKIIVDAVNVLIDAINLLNPFQDIPKVADDFGQMSLETDKVEKSTTKATTAAKKHAAAMRQQAKDASDLYKNFGNLNDIQNKINGALADAFDGFTATSRAMIQSIHDSKGLADAQVQLKNDLKEVKVGSLQSKDALATFAGTYLDAAQNAIEAGKSQKDVTQLVKDGRDAFLKNAEAIGYTKTEATKLADQLGLIPNTITKTFKVQGLGDLQKAAQYLSDIKEAYAARISAGGRVSDAVESYIQGKEAELGKLMNKIFGRGQTKDQPLYVEVTNQGKALGGPVSGNKTYLVGEQGPELFTPGISGNIIPNNALSKLGGTATNSVTVNVQPSAGMDEVELAHMISRKVAWNMRRGV